MCGLKNGQTCQQALSEKPSRNGQKKKPKLDAAREQRGIYSIPVDDPDYEEIMNIETTPSENGTQGEPQRSVAESPNQPTRTVQSGGRPSASDWCKMETKSLKYPCSKQHHENIIIESQRTRTTESAAKLIRTISRTEVTCPCRTTTRCTNRFPYRQQ